MVRFSLSAALLVFAAAAPADDAADLKALVGKWKLEKAEVGGADFLAQLKDLDFEIAPGGKYTAKFGGITDVGTFTVDSTKSPKTMDIKASDGPNKGKTIPAVYKIDGDTVVICYQLGGGDRPKTFESKKDTQLFLATYKRVKP